MNTVNRVLEHIDNGLERYFSKKWHWAITIPAVLLLLLGSYFLFCFSTTEYDGKGFRNEAMATTASILGLFLVLALLAYLVLEIITKRIRGRKVAWVFMGIASICLTLWGFQNALNLGHHHDAGAMGSGNHWSVIYDIYATGEIPPVNPHNQYYQPKFYHAVIAYLMKFNSLFIHVGDTPLTSYYPLYTMSAYHSLELTRVFMIALGIASFYAVYRIFHELGLSETKVGVATALTVMIPELWFIQFFMNNDGFALAFSLFAFALALRFKNSEGIVPLIFSAVTLGLAMMSKLNAALMAFPMAFVFIYVLVKKIRAKDKNALLKLIGKFVLFAVIVFPLGLWTPLYYKAKYDLPIGYVLDLTPTQADKEGYGMYIDPTFYNFFERCFPYPSQDLFMIPFSRRWRHQSGGVYVNAYGDIDFNCWTAFFKSGFFDEWDDFFKTIGYLPAALMVVAMYLEALLCYLGLLGLIVQAVFYFKNKRWKNNLFIPATLLIMGGVFAVNYIYFVNRYPVGCSQNARYVMPLLIPLQAMLASAFVDFHDRMRNANNAPVSPSGE